VPALQRARRQHALEPVALQVEVLEVLERAHRLDERARDHVLAQVEHLLGREKH